MLRLPYLGEQHETRSRLADSLRQAVLTLGPSPIAWCCGPYLLALEDRRPRRGLALGIPLQEWLRHQGVGLAGWSPLRCVQVGSTLYVGTGSNQWRSLEPIVERASLDEVPAVELRPRSLVGIDSPVTEVVRALGDAIGSDPATERMVTRAARKAQRGLRRAATVLDAAEITRVVVATQHEAEVRAFICEARRRGIPTVYIPHAPLSASVIYDDLPVDLAALRGASEVAHYARLGAEISGLVVVGNPGIGASRPPSIDARMPVVLALSWPIDEAMLAAIAVVYEAVGDDVIVAPHPALSRRRLSEVLPDTWKVLSDRFRTWDLLRLGPWCVIQASSGVAAEALYLGLETIELAFPGRPAAYRFLTEPAVRFAEDSVELRSQVEAARAAIGNATRRQAVREHATRWCSTSGDAAISDALKVIRSPVASRSPLLDLWGLE